MRWMLLMVLVFTGCKSDDEGFEEVCALDSISHESYEEDYPYDKVVSGKSCGYFEDRQRISYPTCTNIPAMDMLIAPVLSTMRVFLKNVTDQVKKESKSFIYEGKIFAGYKNEIYIYAKKSKELLGSIELPKNSYDFVISNNYLVAVGSDFDFHWSPTSLYIVDIKDILSPRVILKKDNISERVSLRKINNQVHVFLESYHRPEDIDCKKIKYINNINNGTLMTHYKIDISGEVKLIEQESVYGISDFYIDEFQSLYLQNYYGDSIRHSLYSPKLDKLESNFGYVSKYGVITNNAEIKILSRDEEKFMVTVYNNNLNLVDSHISHLKWAKSGMRFEDRYLIYHGHVNNDASVISFDDDSITEEVLKGFEVDTEHVIAISKGQYLGVNRIGNQVEYSYYINSKNKMKLIDSIILPGSELDIYYSSSKYVINGNYILFVGQESRFLFDLTKNKIDVTGFSKFDSFEFQEKELVLNFKGKLRTVKLNHGSISIPEL